MTTSASRDRATAASTSVAARIAAARLDWIVPQWPAPETVEAFVTTRNGRNEAGHPIAFDPGGHGPPQDAATATAVLADRARLASFLPGEPHWLEQVHGADVVHVGARSTGRPGDGNAAATSAEAPTHRADAAVTRARGIVLAIRVADCLPVLFCNRAGTVVGAAHAGWRGLASGVLENTVAALECDAADVVAWIGPGIGRDAFEVGAEVRQAFIERDAGAKAAFTPGRAGRWYADLEALARRRLVRAGVGAVGGGGMCTSSDAARFYSWRRERARGRMAALIWIARGAVADHAAGAKHQ
ncbi:MAG TPA: peptidoglycan editing factor PgeF [Casimicrobiaceae bacterium]